ncbi:small ribosomal subunit protein uS14 [Hydra vulgaris]|uniref:small ribosomal subunit protein uS14 n=1 Tax=Hydra vulgaris TaxID=6087 RepID=UPI001F5EA70E|nr:30S ribosomal protein S14-like [Hydra vulgaris]
MLSSLAQRLLLPSVILKEVLNRTFSSSTMLQKYYVQKNYLKRWARRDMKRRELFKEFEFERSSLRAIAKSDILPASVKMRASEDLANLPRDSSITRIRHRCTLTDRARGVVIKYRISRIKFRDYADKGLISGYTRSSW